MKKILTTLLFAAMVISVMCVTVSAANFRNEKALVLDVDEFDGGEDPYTTGTPDDEIVEWHSSGYGWFTNFDGYPCFMTSPVANIWEVRFLEKDWNYYLFNYPVLKIRYKIPFVTDTDEIRVGVPFYSGHAFEYTMIADGEWHDLIINMFTHEDLDWSLHYKKELINFQQAHFRMDVQYFQETPIMFDYFGFFFSEEAAEAFNGDPASLDAIPYVPLDPKAVGMILAAERGGPEIEPYPESETTEAVTEAATEAVTEAVTEAATEAATEAVTEAVTEAETKTDAEVIAESATEAVTEADKPEETEAETEVKPESVPGEEQNIETPVIVIIIGIVLVGGILTGRNIRKNKKNKE